MKEEWLSDPSLADLFDSLWDATRRAIVASRPGADGGRAPGPLERGLSEFAGALLTNEALLARSTTWVIDLAATAVDGIATKSGT